MKTHKMKYDFKSHFYVMDRIQDFLPFETSTLDLITTLTYILMDNYCPCLINCQSQFRTTYVSLQLGHPTK